MSRGVHRFYQATNARAAACRLVHVRHAIYAAPETMLRRSCSIGILVQPVLKLQPVVREGGCLRRVEVL